MTGNGKRWLAAATVLAFAALFVGVGVRLSWADEPKTADLTDLRDAVKAANKRGDNVDEVEKALDAFEKAMGKGFKADAKEPPAELTALRNAVESAARKGENVDDIRKQLQAVEMKLVGRVLEAPKPATPPLGDPPPARRDPPARRFPNDLRVMPRIEFPPLPNMDFPNRGGLGGFGGFDNEALNKAMELQRKALEMKLKDPDNPEAEKLAREAVELMLKGLADGRGGIVTPEMLFQDLGGAGRASDRFRFGIRMEKISPIAAEQLGIEAGRGIAVTDVIADSAAAKAGIKPHDIILEFAGKPVSDSPEEFNKQVTAVKAGEKVDAVVLRKGKKVEIKGIVLPEADREIPRLNRRVPQPRIEFPRLPNTLPDLGPRPGARGLSVTLGQGNFTIQSTQDGTTYDLRGTTENGEVKLAEVAIEVDGKSTKYESIDNVPEEHRPAVEKLLKTIGGKAEVRLRPRVKD
jgi:serine protease Do